MKIRKRKYWAEALDVMRHPEVFKWVTYDGYNETIGPPLCSASREWVGEVNGRVVATWQFHDFCPGVVNGHIAALPNTRRMVEGTKDVLERLRKDGIVKVLAIIPVDNISAIAHVRRVGFECEGFSRNVWPRNGRQDMAFYGKSLCQQ